MHLVGPVGGETELLADPPSYLYTAGLLFPSGVTTDLLTVGEGGDGGDGGAGKELVDDAVSLANERLPSSVALSFYVTGSEPRLDCTVAAARYVAEGRQWRRVPGSRETVTLTPGSAPVKCLGGSSHLVSRWREGGDGHVVTVALVNRIRTDNPSLHEPDRCLFQVEMVCAASSGKIADYPATENLAVGDDDAELALRYRHVKTYAVGHGCAADWLVNDAGEIEVRTSFVPFVDVPPFVVTQGDDAALRLTTLRDAPRDQLIESLLKFISGYDQWLAGLRGLPAPETGAGRRARDRILTRIDAAIGRMRAGVDALGAPEVLQAFRLAHDAMVRQMEHSVDQLGGTPHAVAASPAMPPRDLYARSTAAWRPFQLAYILVCLRSIIDPDDSDRPTVDLIWAATGAGKTEAYLALAAIAILHRRLTAGAEGRGTTVLTRYTLRLLTAQQFERTARLACALEDLRGEHPEIGEDPVTIGLWIGDDTPASFTDASTRAQEVLDEERPSGSFQLEKCPWCGVRIIPTRRSPRDAYGFRYSNDDFQLHCPNAGCRFHNVLPVQVVDAALYREPPTILIGTVDKFARLAWLPDAGAFCGGHDTLPPSLIIQDELHLLSGPLGTTVGLYEAALEVLCELHGSPPKVISATATIREAASQIQAIYGRRAELFPPAGLDARDSYFAKEDGSSPGRGYLGVLSPSHTPSTSLVRTCAVLLQAGADLPLSGDERNAYWTVVAYHNSLRELGKTITFARDDIPAWVHMVAADPDRTRELHDDGVLELTGNVDSAGIPASLDRLNTRFDRPGAVSFAACTNMLSVGVDIQRLGLMVINGQPKTTSEYIQASSRVGRDRRIPGLVVAHYSSTKPRDRSHYEHFVPYHRALYRWVEPTSVTPFSLPARDRALHAALVILVRHGAGLRSKADAALFDPSDPRVKRCIDLLCERAGRADPDEADATRAHLHRLAERWLEEIDLAAGDGRSLSYDTRKPYPSLLTTHGSSWGAWPTLHSMRNVDSACAIDIVKEYS
jgi:hypothetical protein